ncbi:MAG TPA: hypothetical protein VFQ79_24720 [Bryobacteraceae bacterium]|nr:hypothetical protein [Bryobacteraceae bacterium]
MSGSTFKHSTILIAAGKRTEVYRSLDQVPPALLRKLKECTGGSNAGTILIADERGREEILRSLRDGAGAGTPVRDRQRVPHFDSLSSGRASWIRVLEVFIPTALAVLALLILMAE